MATDERACSVCGCTDRFGCEEGCHWVESTTIPICSVCAGMTAMRRRSYTRCTPDTEPALMPPLEIYNPAGRQVGYGWHISEAQAMARGIDAYLRALYALLPIPGRPEKSTTHWQRGPTPHHPPTAAQYRSVAGRWVRVARRYRGHVVKLET